VRYLNQHKTGGKLDFPYWMLFFLVLNDSYANPKKAENLSFPCLKLIPFVLRKNLQVLKQVPNYSQTITKKTGNSIFLVKRCFSGSSNEWQIL
jgi:hypothetical protein